MASENWEHPVRFLSSKFGEMPFTIAFAALLGFLFATYTVSIHNAVEDLYDSFFPVVRYKSEIIGGDGDAVLIHIWGKKLRDCNVVRGSLDSYTVRDGRLFDADELKVKGFEQNRPPGEVDVGVFRVWPTTRGDSIQMYVLHDCDGHLVRSKIADVPLPK